METSAAPATLKCPNCSAPLENNHSYTWCAKCGKPLPQDIIAALPQQPKQRTETSSRLLKKYSQSTAEMC
jgi:predicted amidophosphoribosyltransferase